MVVIVAGQSEARSTESPCAMVLRATIEPSLEQRLFVRGPHHGAHGVTKLSVHLCLLREAHASTVQESPRPQPKTKSPIESHRCVDARHGCRGGRKASSTRNRSISGEWRGCTPSEHRLDIVAGARCLPMGVRAMWHEGIVCENGRSSYLLEGVESTAMLKLSKMKMKMKKIAMLVGRCTLRRSNTQVATHSLLLSFSVRSYYNYYISSVYVCGTRVSCSFS